MTDRISLAAPLPATARRGDITDLVVTEYPDARLSDMALATGTRAQLDRVLHEQHQRDLLIAHGFAPLHRLLLTGPPGTGRSMTASALACELSLPLVTIRVQALISKYTGDTAPKLRVLFDAMARARAVCLFDDFDTVGARQMTGCETEIMEARRLLDTFLSFLHETQPGSLIVAVADHQAALDSTLLRRFDAIIRYALPDRAQAVGVLRRRLAALDTSQVCWNEVGQHVRGLTQAGLVRAAESAAKRVILHDEAPVSTAVLMTALGEHRTHQTTGFAPPRPALAEFNERT